MTGDILTPLSLWGGFAITTPPEAELIEDRKNGDIIISKVYIDGRKTGAGQVKIYGVIARDERLTKMPAVLILQDLNRPFDEKTAIELAKRGYLALAVDLNGETEGAKYFTQYPKDISYANYGVAKDKLGVVETDAFETCWYEWASAARYCAAYLNDQSCVNGVVGLGVAGGAGVLWQAVANNPTFKAATFVMNAGWKAHANIYKFGGVEEPQFTDDVLQYIAGVDPQSYAKHVKCPCLMLSTTNSAEYDVDRACDTVARIDENAYRAVNYSVGCIDKMDVRSIEQISMFFGAFVKRQDIESAKLPLEPEIKCDVVDGKIKLLATVDKDGVDTVSVYAAEQITVPAERAWVKVTGGKKIKAGEYEFEYLPYAKSQIVVFFVKATYKNGFATCSNIIAKRFAEKEVISSHKQKIIYSGRIEGAESVFSALPCADDAGKWYETEKTAVTVKKGPMSIDGVTAKGGLVTFKMGAEKYMPDDYAILMLDLFAKQDCSVTVKLIVDYHGAKTEYAYTQNLRGGKIWHNVRIEMSRFKTAEGRILKTYEGVNAISITADGDYLVNNMLWV